MTPLQAREIQEFLTMELNEKGFSFIVDEIDSRVLENSDVETQSLQSEREILLFFITEAIEIFNGISNKDFDALIARLNKHLLEGSIEGIEVSTVGKRQDYINLGDLPDYREISEVFQDILLQIVNDNNTNSRDDNSRN